ncbi:MAG: ABC transporter permease [Bdellovibrionales bacterium]|nr:ABC transporter permease [Bdellovibrionales bacterium]
MRETLWNLLWSTLRMATPLLFATLGGLISERSGVINIGLEGLMLTGAFFAAAMAAWTGSAWFGALAGGLAGALLATLLALFVLRYRAQQIVAGTAINILAAGLTPFLCKIFFGATGSSPALPLSARFVSAPLWMAWLVVMAVWAWLKYTSSGLLVQFAGENPEALVAAGVNPRRWQWRALLASGFLAGLGGACLSVFLSSAFARNMSSGRGFIALAALVLGKWRPWSAAAACLLFGLAEAAQIQLQGSSWVSEGWMPVQLIVALPYVVTLAAMAGFLGRSRPPAALGK